MDDKTLRHTHFAPSLQLYTQDEVAEMLGFSTRTLEGWRHRDYGPPYTKIGGRVRYRHDKLQEWLAEQTRDDGYFGPEGSVCD